MRVREREIERKRESVGEREREGEREVEKQRVREREKKIDEGDKNGKGWKIEIVSDSSNFIHPSLSSL